MRRVDDTTTGEVNDHRTVTRRRALQTTVGVIGATALLANTTMPVTAHNENDEHADTVSITFPDQETSGEGVTIERVETDTVIDLVIRDETDARGSTNLQPGTHTDLTVRLDDPLQESQHLSARAYPDDGGQRIKRVDAHAQLEHDDREYIPEIEPQLITADPDAGFNYPYYMYAPARYADQPATPVFVEPANTGGVSDDMDEHLTVGERTITSGIGREIAGELNAPFIVPVFPRPERNPVDATHYTHALDDTTLQIDNGPLERIDLQVLRMIEDAQQRLLADDYPVATGIMLNGFSASGNFVDRFAVLHADKVTSVTAGGLHGMPILPVEELDGRELPYHVGIADVEEITGDPVDRDALNDTPQFLYMGAEDENDTIPYDDAWTDDELRQLVLDVYGEDMIEDRFARSEQMYEDAGVDATFKVYEGVGHSPREAKSDVVEFHRDALLDEQRGDRTTVTPLGEDSEDRDREGEREHGRRVSDVMSCVVDGVIDALRSTRSIPPF